MDYKIRFATPDDHDLIYALKAESVRPYVERIWGWDEDYQRKDFDGDFAHMDQFNVIEIDGRFVGFVQYYFEYPYFEVVEIHLLPEFRGKGIGSDILRYLQKACIAQDRKIRIGCFKENHRAKHLYQKLGFMQTKETDTHYILEYPNYVIIPYNEKYRDDMIFMVLEAKDALGRVPRLNDDLLDVQGDAAEMGKQTGMDAQRGKMTWPSLVGVDGAKTRSAKAWDDALEALDIFGERAWFMREFAQQLRTRTK